MELVYPLYHLDWEERSSLIQSRSSLSIFVHYDDS